MDKMTPRPNNPKGDNAKVQKPSSSFSEESYNES